MKHYSTVEWADFERGSITSDQKSAMQIHLESGCKPCSNHLTAWRGVVEIGRKETSCQPPAYVIRNAKGAYQLMRPAPGATWVSNLAQMVFDSFRQPLSVGVRASHSAARQLLYKSGSTTVDIRVESQPGTSRLSLVGQVLDAEMPDRSVKDLPIVLRGDKGTQTTTATNEFGEFHFELEATERLLVALQVGDWCNIFLPLYESRGTRRVSSGREAN